MVLLMLTFCLLLLPLWESVIVLCFVVRYFMSILVLQSSGWGRESWLLWSVCLPGVSWLLCGSFSQCHGFVCCLWLWYFLIILTYNFCAFLQSPIFIIDKKVGKYDQEIPHSHTANQPILLRALTVTRHQDGNLSKSGCPQQDNWNTTGRDIKCICTT